MTMRKLIFVAIAVGASVASAGSLPVTQFESAPEMRRVDNPTPTIIGKIRNRAQGEIVLASESCASDPSSRFAFIRESGGKLSLTGCWQMVDDDIVIRWSDGDVFMYPIESIEFTQSFNEWYERNKSNRSNDRRL